MILSRETVRQSLWLIAAAQASGKAVSNAFEAGAAHDVSADAVRTAIARL
jgi:hypothetical protein